MTSTDLNTYVTFGYLACAVLYLIAYASGSLETKFRRSLMIAVILVFGLHTAGIGLRWIESYQMGIGHAPLSNLYESLVFFSWSIALALIVARLRFGIDIIVLLGLPLAFLVMGVIMAGVGMVGEYVGRIYQEVRRRPRYVVSEVLD